MKSILILVIISLVISPNFVGATSSRQKDDPLAGIPPSQRARLKSRLDKFVKYHLTGRWDKVYGLLSEQYKNNVDGGLTKDKFLKNKLYSRVRKFTPEFAYKVGNMTWWVRGCGSFDRVGSTEVLVEAYYQGGDWYFSNFGGPPGCVDCMPLDCKP